MNSEIVKILRNIRDLDLNLQSTSNNLMLGKSKSNETGGGIAFKNLRPYEYGDDHKRIDWKTTAKLGAPYIKEFEAERSQELLIFFDNKTSMDFHSRGRSKREIAITIAALFANYYLQLDCRVSMVTFDNTIDTYLRPSSKKSQLNSLITNALVPATQKKETEFDPKEIYNFTNSQKTKGLDLIVITDFLNITDNLDGFKTLSQRYNVKFVRVLDPLEENPKAIKGLQLQELSSKKNIQFQNDNYLSALKTNFGFEKHLFKVSTDMTNEDLYSVCLRMSQ